MQRNRPRFSIRWLMIVVALCGATSSGLQLMLRRYESLKRASSYHSLEVGELAAMRWYSACELKEIREHERSRSKLSQMLSALAYEDREQLVFDILECQRINLRSAEIFRRESVLHANWAAYYQELRKKYERASQRFWETLPSDSLEPRKRPRGK